MIEDGLKDLRQAQYTHSSTHGTLVKEQPQDRKELGCWISSLNSPHDRRRVQTGSQRSLRSKTAVTKRSCLRYLVLLPLIPTAMAQTCISLADSSQCSAFNASSISTDSTLVGLFPFLASVTSTATFDTLLEEYIFGSFAQERYQTLLGCSAYNTSDPTEYYARYTTSVLCNAIVQNSITPCGLTGNAVRPLCAESCALYAESEDSIASSNACGTAGSNAISQIRADYTNCALPAGSLTGTCITAPANQPDNCGYANNTEFLCSYCSSSSVNATDSCCLYSDTETLCAGVTLPIAAASTLSSLFASATSSATRSTSSGTTSSTGSTSALTGNSRTGALTGGQIAGIVIGSVLGALLLLALLILGCILLRRRRQSSPASSVFNQPAQPRQGPQMAFRNDGATQSPRDPPAEVLPGGRVTRMAALEGGTSSESGNNTSSPGVVGPYAKSSSDENSPESTRAYGAAPPPKRSGSLSSSSALALAGAGAAGGNQSADEAFSSPETSQSEQLDFFKDYYSQDEVHAGDLVATLWAYQPRAADEFELDRGDMLKVIGIWDDGWATGIRVRMQADEWRDVDKSQRDSGMSSNRATTPEEHGDVKAFPMVCVCLPQHWQSVIDGESTDAGVTDDPTSSP